jgi:hypothetical protein
MLNCSTRCGSPPLLSVRALLFLKVVRGSRPEHIPRGLYRKGCDSPYLVCRFGNISSRPEIRGLQERKLQS